MQISLEVRLHNDGPHLVIWMGDKYGYFKINDPLEDELIRIAAAITERDSTAFSCNACVQIDDKDKAVWKPMIK